MHQRRHTVGGRNRRRVDHDLRGVFVVPHNEFLAPVAQNICLQTGGSLGIVTGLTILIGSRVEVGHETGDVAVAPFGDGGVGLYGLLVHAAIEQFVLQITVPIDAEVHSRFLGAHLLSRLNANGILISF